MILAAESSNLPILIAVISAFAGVIAAVVTGIVSLASYKANRRKTTVEADKMAAEIPFQGGNYIKELSDAATSLITPLRTENETLRQRVDALQRRVDELERREEEARQALHRERDLSDKAKGQFDARLRELMMGYQNEIQELKTQIATLEGQIAGAG